MDVANVLINETISNDALIDAILEMASYESIQLVIFRKPPRISYPKGMSINIYLLL